ncbi:MAG TPA: acyltransferase, partial [Humisphaera sp.]
GWAGVDVFFVLSGFLVGGILLDNRDANGALVAFYARRAARIIPLYVVWLGLFWMARTVGSWNDSTLLRDPLPAWSYLTYSQNVVTACTGNWGPRWISATWSLAVEEQFYILLPPLVLILKPRHLGLACCGMAVAAPALRYALTFRAGAWHASYVLLPARCDSLFLGVLGACLVRRPWFDRLLARRPAVTDVAALASAATVAGIVRGWYGRPGWWYFPSVVSVAALSLVLFAVYSPRRRWLEVGVLRWVGGISYGVYMFHMAAQSAAYLLVGEPEPVLRSASQLWIPAVALAGTLAAAQLSFAYFESPLVRLGRRVKYRREATLHADGAACPTPVSRATAR